MYEIRRVVTKEDHRPDWNVIVFEKNLNHKNMENKGDC